MLKASSADMSFNTKGIRDLTVQTGANQGENQVENVYCENQLLAEGCQQQWRKKTRQKKRQMRSRRRDTAQTTKTMGKDSQLKDANQQTRAAKVGSINIEG